MAVLLGITINPVQSYIAESRKLIDLKNSSKIISDVMFEISKEILKNQKNEIIYPNHNKIQDVDYSNTLIFQVEDINKINDHFTLKAIVNKIFFEVNKEIEFNDDREYKLKDIFNCFWAYESIADNDYNLAYKKLMNLMRSIKNTYEFDQVKQDESKEEDHKCSLCNKRNTVKFSDNKQKLEKRLDIDENLCPLCLFKRNYDNKEKIDSVNTVAIRNWKEEYKVDEKLIEVSTLKLPDMYYDDRKLDKICDLLLEFSDMPDDKKIKMEKRLEQINNEFKLVGNKEFDIFNDSTIRCRLKQISDELKKLYTLEEKGEKFKVPRPVYEYAFYQFDIDSLGNWMAGKYFENIDKLKKNQKSLSSLLINFASRLKTKLESDKTCKIIYLGGDDFLGVTALDEIERVWKIVDEIFQNEVVKKLPNTKKTITYSTSITIASCQDPMSYALSVTREQLSKVKNRYSENSPNKDGVSINYLVNNAKSEFAYYKKYEFTDFLAVVEMLRDNDKNISLSFIRNFQDIFKIFNFEDISGDEYRRFLKIAKIEFKRLVKRSIKGYKKEKVIEKLEVLFEFIEKIIVSNNKEYKSNHINVDFGNIKNILGMIIRIKELKLIETNKESGENE